MPAEYRFYGELAAWWPLISPPHEYTEEAAFVAELFDTAPNPVRDILELGSGGGHVAFHLKDRFDMTLVDLSEDMLEVSRGLNPECEHIAGDMRTIRLDRTFDAVFIYDAIDYMTSIEDLRRAIETAFIHCRPGGVALLVPDHITENVELGTDHGGYDGDDGRGARYLEWSTLEGEEVVRTDYVFLLRDLDGSMRSAHETHRTGLFRRQTWVDVMSGVGFEPEVIVEVTSEDRLPRELFIGHRPTADRVETADVLPHP